MRDTYLTLWSNENPVPTKFYLRTLELILRESAKKRTTDPERSKQLFKGAKDLLGLLYLKLTP
jgi:hypothetical protein